ncbi:MAG: methylenetetrahydrofolate--tRNA-(uracil(54)-C(5))-methyltransferase (FADH(2)-oxidizing) TrmFO [Ruminococcus sp.]|uniref:methylenetetrahydrofolate--tRNA-(uracil(54)- C(5))-methyltransferase (FADH(2)-oxidizing) TrmFO n=1 Tax=Ruminococcus sp. TaxID=41978 RepID=UPI0025F73DDC|nr:methylenetetrahydrofolate--tRNA-(uracil(54)-C(5))-methyltransferase (FADH(2)-oxidizing) TrmFO [Ruminococcus sp.]MCR5601379.1 methylenetetrahydrofolate--tRNA-(uracil(54)-C(5))-methyltransferase (FADH(2)-oxidizing) TrmFO [Ruminococcus sp.]
MSGYVNVIGAGLAGCEAAWAVAEAGINVRLYEMKPEKFSPAHKYGGFAELVCSNSLKAARVESAAGLLKYEMELLGSLTVPCAKENAVEAGGALAVDREKFSDAVTEKIKSHPLIEVIGGEVTELPEGMTIIATGPLTQGAMADKIKELCGEGLSFYDAAAPIVTAESIDMEKAFYASRYDRGDADYVNCPMNKEEYLAFHAALIAAEKVQLKDFETHPFSVYEGCMPIEELASRGVDTMRFGPMKPVGIDDPRTGRRPYAVVQLRKENREGTLFNLVGFQTNLKFGEQKRVFSMIPGLENAEFMRFGVMHRNTFINSPELLNSDFSMRSRPEIFFAGQITGVEGYMESAASGLIAGIAASRRIKGLAPIELPLDTMTGALSHYVSDPFNSGNFQPMGANMGILPDIGIRIKDKKERYGAYAQRAVESLKGELERIGYKDNC